jgi:hypothetical protein
MRSVSAQLSVAGVADQLHGKSSEKLASAVWIRPVGRLPGHFTRVEAITNCAVSDALHASQRSTLGCHRPGCSCVLPPGRATSSAGRMP